MPDDPAIPLVPPARPKRVSKAKIGTVIGSDSVLASKPAKEKKIVEKRLAVYYGRKEGELIVVVETSPDWDGESKWCYTLAETRIAASVARTLGFKVKNTTMEELE